MARRPLSNLLKVEIGTGLTYYPRMTSPRPLGDGDFARIVRCAPLVSIDIIVRDPQRYSLLGLRVNEPARSKYFVPGGAIRKNDTIRDAFARILKAKIGIKASLDNATFVGVFEHFYEMNRFGNPEYGIHYVVLAYEIIFPEWPLIEIDS